MKIYGLEEWYAGFLSQREGVFYKGRELTEAGRIGLGVLMGAILVAQSIDRLADRRDAEAK